MNTPLVNKEAEEKVTQVEQNDLTTKAAEVVKQHSEVKASNYKPSVQPYVEALRILNAQAIGGNFSFSAAQSAEQTANNTTEVTKLQEDLAVKTAPKVSDNPAITQAVEQSRQAIADGEKLAQSNSKVAIVSPSHVVTSAPNVMLNATSSAGLIAPYYHVNASTQTNTTNFYGLSAEVLNTRATNSVQLADNSWINNTYRNVIARTNEVKGETSAQYFSQEIASVAPRIQEEGEINYTNFVNKESIVSKESITRVGESSITVVGSASPSLDDLNKATFLNLKPKLGIPNLGSLNGLAQSALKSVTNNSLLNFNLPEAINNTIIYIKDGNMTQMTNTMSSQFQVSKSQGQQVQVLADTIQNLGLSDVVYGANKAAMLIGNDMAAIGNNRGNGFTMIGKKVFFGGMYNLVPIASSMLSIAQTIPGIKIPNVPAITPKSNPFLSKDLEACSPNARKDRASSIPIVKTPDFNPDLESPEIGIGSKGSPTVTPPSSENIKMETQEALATKSGAVITNETTVRGNNTVTPTTPAKVGEKPPVQGENPLPKTTSSTGIGEGVKPSLGTSDTEKKVEGTANGGTSATTGIVVSAVSVYTNLFRDSIVVNPDASREGTNPPLCFDNTCVRSPDQITATLLSKVNPDIEVSDEVIEQITASIEANLTQENKANFSIEKIINDLKLEPEIAKAILDAYKLFPNISIGGLVPSDSPIIPGAISDNPGKDTPSILERGQSYLGTFKSYIEKVPILRDTDLARQLTQSVDSVGNILNNNLVRLTYDVISNGASYDTTGGILEGFSPEVREKVLSSVINITASLPEEREAINNIVEYWAGYLLIGGENINEQQVLSQITTVLDNVGVSANAISILQSSANLALQISNGEIINLLADPNINNIISRLGLNDEIQKISSVIATASKVADTVQTIAALPGLLKNIEGEGIASLIELGKIVSCLDLFNKVRSTIDVLKNPFNYRSATPEELQRLVALLDGGSLNIDKAVEVLPLELTVEDYNEIETKPVYQNLRVVEEDSADVTEFTKAIRSYKDRIVSIAYKDTQISILDTYFLIVGADNAEVERVQVVEGSIVIYDLEVKDISSVRLNNNLEINK